MSLAIAAIASLTGLAASLPILKLVYRQVQFSPTFLEWSVNVAGLLGVIAGICLFGGPGFVIGFAAGTGMWLSPQLCDRLFKEG